MIIEIKDLPDGKQIKKITFDIEFEDGNIRRTTNRSDYDGTPVGNPNVSEESKSTEECKPVDVPVEREAKEIPPEMTDMEF
jgi:hypothetical protein